MYLPSNELYRFLPVFFCMYSKHQHCMMNFQVVAPGPVEIEKKGGDITPWLSSIVTVISISAHNDPEKSEIRSLRNDVKENDIVNIEGINYLIKDDKPLRDPYLVLVD